MGIYVYYIVTMALAFLNSKQYRKFETSSPIWYFGKLRFTTIHPVALVPDYRSTIAAFTYIQQLSNECCKNGLVYWYGARYGKKFKLKKICPSHVHCVCMSVFRLRQVKLGLKPSAEYKYIK